MTVSDALEMHADAIDANTYRQSGITFSDSTDAVRALAGKLREERAQPNSQKFTGQDVKLLHDIADALMKFPEHPRNNPVLRDQWNRVAGVISRAAIDISSEFPPA